MKIKSDKKVNAEGRTLGEFLAAYDPSLYRKPAVTADCLIFAQGPAGTKVLMVKRGNHPCIGQYALPGGFCNYGESADETARRELKEETGADFNALRLLCFSSAPGRDPRDWIMTAVFMGVTDTPFEAVGGDDAASAEWLAVTAGYDGNNARLTLKADRPESGGEIINAGITVVRDAFGKIDLNKSTASGSIAFDHAKILLMGLEELLAEQPTVPRIIFAL